MHALVGNEGHPGVDGVKVVSCRLDNGTSEAEDREDVLRSGERLVFDLKQEKLSSAHVPPEFEPLVGSVAA